MLYSPTPLKQECHLAICTYLQDGGTAVWSGSVDSKTDKIWFLSQLLLEHIVQGSIASHEEGGK